MDEALAACRVTNRGESHSGARGPTFAFTLHRYPTYSSVPQYIKDHHRRTTPGLEWDEFGTYCEVFTAYRTQKDATWRVDKETRRVCTELCVGKVTKGKDKEHPPFAVWAGYVGSWTE